MTTNIKKAPALECDEGHDLLANGKIERRIVWNLIGRLWDAGFKVVAVDDGDEYIRCDKAEHPAMTAMEAIFAVDEATLVVQTRKRGGKAHGIKLVGGNGEDIISDWGYQDGDPDKFNAFMDAFIASENW